MAAKKKSYVVQAEDSRPFTFGDLRRCIENAGLGDDAALLLQGADGEEINLSCAIAIPEWDVVTLQMDEEEYFWNNETDPEEDMDPPEGMMSTVVMPECAPCADIEKGDSEHDLLDAVEA